jgi:uncharacterized protein YhaN
MKILSLSMDAWGPFTNWSVDLSKGSEGMHLIYGLNEAGKSAALRGLKALLFGIEERPADAFHHDYKKLRIAAALQGPDGKILNIVRKKGRTKTLLTPDDEVIDERILQEFLGGVTGETFSRMFGLSHDELTAGGKEIVSGQGDVGQSLFVAALGGHSVSAILDPLEEEAGKLFAPKAAAKRVVNVWYEEYHQAAREAKEFSLPCREWEEHTRKFDDAQERKTTLQQEIRSVESELGRLERIRAALNSIGLRKQLQEKRAAMGNVLILHEGFPETRRATIKLLSDAREKKEKAQKKLKELEEQTKRLIIPAALLDEAEAVSGLHELLGSHISAMRDLPKRRGEESQLEADAGAILKDIHPEAALEEADSFKIGLAKRKLVRELGGKHEALELAQSTAERDVEKLRAKIEKARNSLAAAAAPRDIGPLKDLLKRVRRFGDLEAELEKLRNKRDAETAQSEIEMQRLPLCQGSLDQLEAMPVPNEETVARYEKAFAEIEQKSRETETKRNEKRAREVEVGGRLKTLELTTAVPTEEHLMQARCRRETGWKLVRAAWLEGGVPQDEVEAFCAGDALDQSYEKSVLGADEAADRLRREADRVAEHAALTAERDRVVDEIQQLTEKADGLSKAHLELWEEWRKVWQEAGIDPLTPLEMRSWMQKHRAIVERAASIRGYSQQIGASENHVAGLRGETITELKRIAENEPQPILGFNALTDHCQSVADRIDKENSRRQKLEEAVEEGEKDLTDTMRKSEEAGGALQAWQTQWAQAVAEIGLGGSASTEVASQLLDRIQELATKNEALNKMRRRIEAMERDAQDFERRAQELAKRVAPDLLNLPAEGIAARLNERLAKGREDDAARKQLLQQCEGQSQELSDAEEAMRKAGHALEDMLAFAKCGNVEELEAIERLSAEATETDAKLKTTEIELLAFAAGGTVEDLLHDAQAVNPDALPGRIAEIRQLVSSKQEELSTIEQIIGSERNELARMDGSSRAADAAEKAQSSLAQIRDGIERYARLRLACIVLKREMEQYRAKNQGPVLKRASEIFAALTLGSFSGLMTDVEGDRLVLKGLRPSEEQLGVEGMSDGTCDQLYLSLRLASLEKHLEAQKPIPFIIDDILVNFDDLRAEATLKVLAEFSKKTQIIFFTHHQHLLPLAERSIPGDVLHIHPMNNGL